MSQNFFTRTKYDPCASNKTDLENKHAFSITTDSSSLPGKRCFSSFNSGYNGAHGVPNNFVDVSSELRGQTRIITRCPGSRFNPVLNCTDCSNCSDGLPCGCDHCKKKNDDYLQCSSDNLNPQYTRLNKACNIFSGITIDRFDPLIKEVQIPESSLIAGKNTRIQSKDQFKQIQQEKGLVKPAVDISRVNSVSCKKLNKRSFCQ